MQSLRLRQELSSLFTSRESGVQHRLITRAEQDEGLACELKLRVHMWCPNVPVPWYTMDQVHTRLQGSAMDVSANSSSWSLHSNQPRPFLVNASSFCAAWPVACTRGLGILDDITVARGVESVSYTHLTLPTKRIV